MARPLIISRKKFLDGNGDPLAGGKLYSYEAGTQTPLSLYADPDGEVPHENPIILDANGEATIYMGTALYKLVLTDADDVEQWSEDDLNGNLTTAEDGIDGRSVLNGSGAPSDEFGNNGDFYYDPTAKIMYGPKASGEWPEGISLTGNAGTDGNTVLSGSGAPSDEEDGVDGDFYIDTDADEIYGPKFEGAWGTGVSIVGPAGENGTNGSNGADGKTVLNGTVDPTTEGVDGDFYINTSSNTLFGPKASGTWPSGVSLVGPQGGVGNTGSQGDPGANGTAIWDDDLAGTFDAGDTTYTLSQTPAAEDELTAYLNGVMRRDFSLAGAVVTFSGQDTTEQTADFHYRYIP